MNYIRKALRESLLVENILSEGFNKVADAKYQNVKFHRTKNLKTYITYNFELNGYNYYVDIFTTKEKSLPKGTYDVLFGFDGQKGSSDTVNQGTEHLKYVLYTSARIMDIECKEKQIKYYHMEGFPTNKELDNDPMGPTKRSRIYNIFFSEYYHKNALIINGRYTVVMMNKVFPEVFRVPEAKERKNYHILGQFLEYVNNGDSDFNVWDNIEVLGNEYSVSTDEINNKTYGGLDLDIDVNEDESRYEIEYTKFDIGESDSARFNNFDSLFNYMQQKLLSKERERVN